MLKAAELKTSSLISAFYEGPCGQSGFLCSKIAHFVICRELVLFWSMHIGNEWSHRGKEKSWFYRLQSRCFFVFFFIYTRHWLTFLRFSFVNWTLSVSSYFQMEINLIFCLIKTKVETKIYLYYLQNSIYFIAEIIIIFWRLSECSAVGSFLDGSRMLLVLEG